MKRFFNLHHRHIQSFSSKLLPFSSIFTNFHQMTTASTTVHHLNRRKKKVIVMMGPTGSGKSKLSIDLATRFFPKSEIINSDKIQVYRGLDITTNKIQMHERGGVPHHFLGECDPETEFSPSEFRLLAAKTIDRKELPFVVGGSNSFIYALLAKRFSQNIDVFNESHPFNSVCSDLRYDCCFLWVDVSMPVLTQYLNKRVDIMLDSGMFEELAQYFDKEGFTESEIAGQTGLKKAIGVPEFERYFKRNGKGRRRCYSGGVGADVGEVQSYEEAVKAIKDNTCQLAMSQLGKILRLRDAGWDLHRIDATEAIRAILMTSDSGGVEEIWNNQVVQPSVKIVKQFMLE